MIPRVEVWTSGDVTVEELRGRGRRAAAHRRRRSRSASSERRAAGRRRLVPARRAANRCCSRSTPATRRPCSGCSRESGSSEQFRVGTEPRHTADELAVLIRAFVDLEALDGIVLSSTVPQLRARVRGASPNGGRAPSCSCSGPASRPASRSATTIPREVGPDRIANSVAARERHGAPAIVVDFGTSTNFDVVSAAGEYLGGVLAPGIEISMDALFARAARLLKVPFEAPEHVIGKTTTQRPPVRPRLRLRGPGRRDRRADPRGARRAGRDGRRHGRPRRR